MADYRDRMAERIRRERKRRGLQPIDVAYKIGVDKRTYERWEAGTIEPRPANLRALAREWELEIKDLRPELDEETEQLDRIETMLHDVLDRLDAIEAEQIVDDASEADDQADQQDEAAGGEADR